MSDIVERANVMLSTYRLAASKGIAQAYPDDAVTGIVTALVAEIVRLRPFSRCPGCARTDATIATLHEESPDIACSFCGYGT